MNKAELPTFREGVNVVNIESNCAESAGNRGTNDMVQLQCGQTGVVAAPPSLRRFS